HVRCVWVVGRRTDLFVFQAEDGIRDATVTGVQTCALPISRLRITWRFHWDIWKRIFRISIPLALAGGMGAIYMNIDSVMLGYWGQMTETGWYSAASKVSGIMTVPMILLVLVIFPAFVSTADCVDET